MNRGEIEMADKEEEPLKPIFLKGTMEILKYAVEKGAAQNREFQQFGSQYTVNARLKYLHHYGILQHCFLKEDVRREWYEPTEKGRKVFYCLRCVRKIILEDSPCSCQIE